MSEAKIEPPIQAEYMRSGAATHFTIFVGGINCLRSFAILSAMPNKYKA